MSNAMVDRLHDPELLALVVRSGGWLRSLLTDTVIPDSWIGLIARADGRRVLAPSGERPRLDREDRLLLVRNRPIAVALTAENVRAACGRRVDAACEVLLRWTPREAELSALWSTLVPGETLGVAELAAAVAAAGGQRGLSDLITAHTAEELVDGDRRAELLAELSRGLARFLFESGARIERIAMLAATSRALERERAQEAESDHARRQIAAREMLESARAVATARRLDRASELLERMRRLTDRTDGTEWHSLLPEMSPADRTGLLGCLWRIAPDRHKTTALVAVAGQACLWFDSARPRSVARRVELPSSLGALRSVRHDPATRRLLLGAVSGVWQIDDESGEVAGRFEAPAAESPRTGFNAALNFGDRLLATHSQLGCWSWPLAEPARAIPILVPHGGAPTTIRALSMAESNPQRVLFAADDCVYAVRTPSFEPQLITTAHARVTAVADTGASIFVGTEDGRLLRFMPGDNESALVVHRCPGALESIVVRRWFDLLEVLVAGRENGIVSVYPDEGAFVAVLEHARPLRRVVAADDSIAALTELRDWVVIQIAAAGDPVEMPAARLAGGVIEDIAIVTRPVEPPTT